MGAAGWGQSTAISQDDEGRMKKGLAFGFGVALGFGAGFVLTVELIEWLHNKGLKWPPK